MNLDKATLERSLIELSQGDVLFEQGKRSKSMYIILSGKIELRHKVNEVERVVAYLGQGEIMGEKTLFVKEPFKTAFKASAATKCQLLEFGQDEIKVLLAKKPDFCLQIIETVTRRLDRANHYISVLKMADPNRRLLNFLVFHGRNFGEKSERGIEISLSFKNIAMDARLDEPDVKTAIDYLIHNNLIVQEGDKYLIPDDNALIGFEAELQKRMAA